MEIYALRISFMVLPPPRLSPWGGLYKDTLTCVGYKYHLHICNMHSAYFVWRQFKQLACCCLSTVKYTDRKENQIFLIFQYLRKFRMEQLQSHIRLTASSYMGEIFAHFIFFFISALFSFRCSHKINNQ
jgi:hypothetical protein